jgi:hypothetical protein
MGRAGFSCLKTWFCGGLREHCSEPSGFIRRQHFFDELSFNQLFKNCPAHLSK